MLHSRPDQNKQIEENSTSRKTPQELLNFLQAFLSLTSIKTFLKIFCKKESHIDGTGK